MNSTKTRKKRESKPMDLSTMVYGKVPPQAKDLEQAILGAVLMHGNLIDNVAEILRPECFYVDAHQKVFRAMLELAQRSQPIDMLMVINRLKETEELDLVGGPFVVMQLTNNVTSHASLEAHSRIVYQNFMKRECIRLGGQLIAEAYEDSGDAFELLSSHEYELSQIAQSTRKTTYSHVETEAFKRLQRIEELRQKNEYITGIPTGFRDVDTTTHGWQDTDLIILAARPSVGKTAFALNLAYNAAVNPYRPTPVAFFSLEMSKGQLTDRLLSRLAQVELGLIRNGKVDDEQSKRLYSAVEMLSKAPIYMDDTAALNIFELRAKCRRLKAKHGVGLIVVDYLQLMSSAGDARMNREQVISQISRELKITAKELGVPIIALSQLSRDPEKRAGAKKMPQLADLRESGAIEQDADVVMFLYREEYHDPGASETGDVQRGETKLKFAKHRNGTLDEIHLLALLQYQQFTNYDMPARSNWKPVKDAVDFTAPKQSTLEL